MKVVFIAWRDLAHPNAGGSEIVVDRLICGLNQRGHQAELVCGGPVGPRPYPVTRNGSTYTQYLKTPVTMRAMHDADLVVDVVNGMPYFSPLWWRGPRLCLVHHVHGDQWQHYFPAPVAKIGRVIECRAMPLAYRHTNVIAISDSTRQALETIGFSHDQIHLMHSGLDDDLFAEPEPEDAEPMFLAFGRLAPNKGFDRLLSIWDEVRPVTGGRLVIAGDGPERARLEALAGPDVEFTGRVSEERKRELLGSAWLLVHTAHQEGWGLVIMEAAATNTPSLAFDVVGVRDAIVDGVTGTLAVDHDSFVAEWIALSADPARRARLGRDARARAREFSWDATIDAFLKAAAAAGSPEHTSRGGQAVIDPDTMPTGLARSARLFNLFRREPTDPDTFYRFLAADTVRQLRQFQSARFAGRKAHAKSGRFEQGRVSLEGAHAVDIGGGPGYLADALRAERASCFVVEYDFDELHLHGRTPDRAVQGDGQQLPIATGSVDLVHSSNVLEHVPEPTRMLAEMARILKPDTGLGYVTFTNWYSPWGGHETSPWHYLGGERAADRFERKNGRRPKNEFRVSLHPLHIAAVNRWFAARPDLEVLWAGPRYWPTWARPINRVPGLREVITWNLVVVFRRHEPDARSGPR